MAFYTNTENVFFFNQQMQGNLALTGVNDNFDAYEYYSEGAEESDGIMEVSSDESENEPPKQTTLKEESVQQPPKRTTLNEEPVQLQNTTSTIELPQNDLVPTKFHFKELWKKQHPMLRKHLSLVADSLQRLMTLFHMKNTSEIPFTDLSFDDRKCLATVFEHTHAFHFMLFPDIDDLSQQMRCEVDVRNVKSYLIELFSKCSEKANPKNNRQIQACLNDIDFHLHRYLIELARFEEEHEDINPYYLTNAQPKMFIPAPNDVETSQTVKDFLSFFCTSISFGKQQMPGFHDDPYFCLSVHLSGMPFGNKNDFQFGIVLHLLLSEQDLAKGEPVMPIHTMYDIIDVHGRRFSAKELRKLKIRNKSFIQEFTLYNEAIEALTPKLKSSDFPSLTSLDSTKKNSSKTTALPIAPTKKESPKSIALPITSTKKDSSKTNSTFGNQPASKSIALPITSTKKESPNTVDPEDEKPRQRKRRGAL